MRRVRSDPVALDDFDRVLINGLQDGFPLTERPFAQVAAQLGCTEATVIKRVQALLEQGVLSRFGPMFQIERIGGAFCLAAIKVPEARFAEVSEIVNGFAEVAHNYRREHALNMWFVLATEKPEGIAETAARIELAIGLRVHCFPKEREFFVEMKLKV
jgi:DNA-binding Lrp family transcriptional regulator